MAPYTSPLVELTLVRHGESEGNVAASRADAAGAERIDLPARDADVELSRTGRSQAEALGRHLARLPAEERPAALWVSPYRRARETARLALETAGLELPTTIDERLRDRELGILDGLTARGVEARYPDEAERRRFLGKFYYRPPGGESWADAALRLRSVLRDVEESGVDRVLIVGHDATTSLVRYICEHLTEVGILEEVRARPVANASITRLVRERSGCAWRAAVVGDVTHLTADSDTEVTEHRGDDDGTRPAH